MPHLSRERRRSALTTAVHRRLFAGLFVATALLIAVSAAEASSQTSFTLTGRGWGHGIGMSQWGAYGLAKHGSTYKEILKHYYTGIGFTTVKDPTIRVRLRSGLSTVRLSCASAFTASAGGTVVTIPAGTTATTTYTGGKYHVAAGDQSWTLTGAVTFAPSKGQLNLRTATDIGQTGRHRGTIRVVASGGSLMMINHVPLESYLRSVVPHEVSPSWPKESLKAQACAARAYAERARRDASGAWDLYCDVRSQAYCGVSWEDARSDAAIRETAGIVPSYRGAPIAAFYFSCSGGYTENIELAWETAAVPYLKAVKDPYDSYATLHTWGPLRRTSAQLTASLGSSVKGTLQAIYAVKRGNSPRIVKAAIIGSSGTTYLHGSSLRVKLGLYSTWVTFKSLSIAPAAQDKRTIAKGASVTLQGRVYPALASGATVKLMDNRDGTWRSRSVVTTRRTQALPSGYVAEYSAYSITLSPGETTRYYFVSDIAKSPTTTVTVSP
jgi:stage II sporulation protein D